MRRVLLRDREGEVGHGAGAAHDRVLVAFGELLDAVGDPGVEAGDRDDALVQQVRLAEVDPFDQRFGEVAVPELRRLQRTLAPLRGREHDQPVLGLGEFVDDAVDVDRTARARDRLVGVAGVEEQDRLAVTPRIARKMSSCETALDDKCFIETSAGRNQ